ncbi:hydroxyphenylacetyl-CoA thioesterase PaaI [Streptomyces sp. NPDC058045]|uniref:hydroxyphenylacetyl-CoA thioesterase PaaI n=1 Tax=Streptomyces sp. NPDC058045 TaxID=3346311 RepID=UPI0036E1706A
MADDERGSGAGGARKTGAAGDAAGAWFAADRVSGLLGFTLVESGPGRAVLRMAVRGDMVNGHGTAHGGYLFLFADTAFACACNSHGPLTVAAGADIDFLAPVHEGDTLLAVAEERTRAGRSGIYDVRLLCGETVVAEFRGRSRTLRPGNGGTTTGS